MSPLQASYAASGVWLLSWIVAAFWADRAAQRPPWREEWLYRVIVLAGGYLLYRDAFPDPPAAQPLWAIPPAPGWALFAAVLAGFAFAWWARIHLGRLWSSSVTRKAGHRVVDTGPYALVRHPIYTGLLLAVCATAIESGTPRALAGALAFWVGFWLKARLEERFLSDHLGRNAYDAYRRRAPMLIPFWPRG